MSRFFTGVLVGAVFGTAAVTAGASAAGEDVAALALEDLDVPANDMVRGVKRVIKPRDTSTPMEVNVVLNRDGATLKAGRDDARRGTSSLLLARDLEVHEVPAFGISDREWAMVRGCVAERYADFNVNVLDEAPIIGNYMEVHVGGNPAALGRSENTRGLAPYTGDVLANAPMFVFTNGGPTSAELCQTITHEIGHAIGLDHTLHCSDVMSYEDCGDKHFRLQSDECGEYESRECGDGTERQSSAGKLEARVGRRHRHHRHDAV